MTTRYYFSDDNLDGLITLLSGRPAGNCKVLIGTDQKTDLLPHILARLTVQDKTLAQWVIAKIEAKKLDIRVGHKVNMPQGRTAPKEDDAFLNAFRKSAHEANFTQAQMDAAVGSFYAEVDRQESTVSEAHKRAEMATEDELRKEWGQDYRTNKAMAEALLARAPAGFRDRFMNGYLEDHTPIKASPDSWKWLVQMEREINPAATVMPGAGGDLGKTIEAEIIEIQKHMAKHGQPPYYKGPESEKMKARYRDLLTAQEKLKAKAG